MKILVVLFVLVSLCVCWTRTNGSREHWVDPTDLHNYDHVNKKMKDTEGLSSQYKSCEPHNHAMLTRCETNLDNVLDASRKEKHTSRFLLGMLQRHTAIVLAAAGLLEEDYEDGQFRHAYLLLSLSKEQLKMLRTFASHGKLDLDGLDATWSEMWSPVEDPNRSKWSWVRRWLPFDHLYISKETFILGMEFGVVICPIIMLALRMSLRRVIATFVFLLVLVSVVLRYHRVMQATEMRMQHMLMDPSQMPPECRPHKLSWWEAVKLFFSTEDPAVKCARYYERTHTDPVTQTTPLEQLFHLLMDIVEASSARMGTATKQFCDAAFADLPFPFNSIVCTVAKLGYIIVFAVMSMVMLWYCVTGFGGRVGRGAADRITSQNPEAVTPPPPVTVTNHIHLTVTRGAEGMEAIENVSMQSNQQGKKFLRAQSEGSISFSSQPAVSIEPENLSSEDSRETKTRDRSASEGAFSAVGVKTCCIGEASNTTTFKSVSPFSADLNFQRKGDSSDMANFKSVSPFSELPAADLNNQSTSSKTFGSSPPSTKPMMSDSSRSPKCNNLTILEEDENIADCDESIEIMETEVVSPSRSEASSLSPNTSCLADYLESLQLDESISEVINTSPSSVTSPLLDTIEAELSQFEVVHQID